MTSILIGGRPCNIVPDSTPSRPNTGSVLYDCAYAKYRVHSQTNAPSRHHSCRSHDHQEDLVYPQSHLFINNLLCSSCSERHCECGLIRRREPSEGNENKEKEQDQTHRPRSSNRFRILSYK